jgi:hypothetical protein
MPNQTRSMSTILLKEISENKISGPTPLSSLADILEQIRFSGRRNGNGQGLAGRRATGLMGLLGFVSAVLYVVGYMPITPASALLLAGWASMTRLNASTTRIFAVGISHVRAVVLRALDAAIILGTALVLTLREQWPETVMVWAVAAVLTLYLSYYSQVAILKSVPAGLRTGEPETMVSVDHMFLDCPVLWGPDRELFLGLTALGLFIGLPEWGLAAAVAAGNLNWILKFIKLRRELDLK